MRKTVDRLIEATKSSYSYDHPTVMSDTDTFKHITVDTFVDNDSDQEIVEESTVFFRRHSETPEDVVNSWDEDQLQTNLKIQFNKSMKLKSKLIKEHASVSTKIDDMKGKLDQLETVYAPFMNEGYFGAKVIDKDKRKLKAFKQDVEQKLKVINHTFNGIEASADKEIAERKQEILTVERKTKAVKTFYEEQTKELRNLTDLQQKIKSIAAQQFDSKSSDSTQAIASIEAAVGDIMLSINGSISKYQNQLQQATSGGIVNCIK